MGGGVISVDLGAPIDLWSFNSAVTGTKLKYNDLSISFGLSGKYFWNNNFGIFGNLDGTKLLSREIERGGVKAKFSTKGFKTNIGLFISAGPAYRISLGASADLYIGVGPSYTLYVLELESTTTYLLHMLGVAVEPGIIVNFGKNLVFDAGLSLGFNFLRLQNMEETIGFVTRTVSSSFDEYFGVTISPHIGIGYSF